MNWRVWHAGRASGPFSHEEIAAALQTGSISWDALVCGDDGNWSPIQQHFPPKATKGTANKPSSGVERTSLVLATLIFLPLMAFVVLLRSSRQFDNLTINIPWLWTAASLSAFTLMAVCSCLWWRATGRMRATRAEAAAGLKVLIVLVTAASAVMTGTLWHSASYSSELTQAQSMLRDYTIDHHPMGNSINVTGSIGPGFANELTDVLRTQDITQIEINSRGGLIVEALRAAREIERRNMTVVARGECDSACIIVLMAGQRREADYNMQLGFHAPSRIIGGQEDREMREERRAAKSYMIARGVPERLIAQADKLGADHIYYVPAFQLVRLGVLTGLLSGDTPVDPENAALLASLTEGQRQAAR